MDPITVVAGCGRLRVIRRQRIGISCCGGPRRSDTRTRIHDDAETVRVTREHEDTKPTEQSLSRAWTGSLVI